MKSTLVSFISGVVFALGLGIGGMTQPAKVIGFLDFTGNWDPSLAFVMLGAIGVHSLFYRVLRNRPSSDFSLAISLPCTTERLAREYGGECSELPRRAEPQSHGRKSVVRGFPSRTEIEPRLIGGSIIFGLGWGIAGFCPGPALTSLASGNSSAVIFSVAMTAGIFVFDFNRVVSTRQVRAEHFSGEITEDM